MVSRARLLGCESRLELVPGSESGALGSGEVCWRHQCHQDSCTPVLSVAVPGEGKTTPGSRARSPFLCGFAVSLQRPLAPGLQLALAGKGKGSQGPALASQRQAARVGLELRDNTLMTGTVNSQKDRGWGVVRVCLPHSSSKFCDVARLHLISIVVGM